MNIFILSESPSKAAQYHCDQHVLKMIIEYAQLLATAHRLLDGTHKRVKYITKTGKERTKSVWVHPDPEFESGLYAATHVNHPCAVWARECDQNYRWLHTLWNSCVSEYRKRYGKSHKTYESQHSLFRSLPKNIPSTDMRTPFPLAMPDEFKHDNPVIAYRSFYVCDKSRFATYRYSDAPVWYKAGLELMENEITVAERAVNLLLNK